VPLVSYLVKTHPIPLFSQYFQCSGESFCLWKRGSLYGVVVIGLVKLSALRTLFGKTHPIPLFAQNLQYSCESYLLLEERESLAYGRSFS